METTIDQLPTLFRQIRARAAEDAAYDVRARKVQADPRYDGMEVIVTELRAAPSVRQALLAAYVESYAEVAGRSQAR